MTPRPPAPPATPDDRRKAVDAYGHCTATVAQLAAQYHCSESTIYRWIRDDPRVKTRADAKAAGTCLRGHDRGRYWVTLTSGRGRCLQCHRESSRRSNLPPDKALAVGSKPVALSRSTLATRTRRPRIVAAGAHAPGTVIVINTTDPAVAIALLRTEVPNAAWTYATAGTFVRTLSTQHGYIWKATNTAPVKARPGIQFGDVRPRHPAAP